MTEKYDCIHRELVENYLDKYYQLLMNSVQKSEELTELEQATAIQVLGALKKVLISDDIQTVMDSRLSLKTGLFELLTGSPTTVNITRVKV